MNTAHDTAYTPSKAHLMGRLLTRADVLVAMVVGVLALASVYYWLLLRVTNLATSYRTIVSEPMYLAAITVLVPVTLVLFGLNVSLALLLLRAGGGVTWQSGSLLGAFTGSFAAACPVCGAFLLSLIGVTGGLTVLPFGGLEIWAVSAVIMGVAFGRSLHVLDAHTCDRTVQTASCWRLPPVDRRLVAVLTVLALASSLTLYTMIRVHEPFL